MGTEAPPVKDPARWERRYTVSDIPWDTGKPDPFLEAYFQNLKDKPLKILEIGCGTGTNALWLTQQGCKVVALDLSPTAVAIAQAKIDSAGVECRVLAADFLKDPIEDGPFDLIYDRAVFHIFETEEERERFAKRAAGLLGEDGVWFSLLGSTDGPPRDTGPPRRSAQEITASIEPFFEILSLQATYFDEEGHPGAKAWTLSAKRR